MSSTSKTFTSTSISSTTSSKSKTTSSLLSITAEATSHNIITSSITLSEVMSSTSMSSTFDGMNSITSYYMYVIIIMKIEYFTIVNKCI